MTLNNLNTTTLSTNDLTVNNELTTNILTVNGTSTFTDDIKASYIYGMTTYLSGPIYQRGHITYLFDDNAKIYFGKLNNNLPVGNIEHYCVAHGFFDWSGNNLACISTEYSQYYFTKSDEKWLMFLGIKIHGYWFRCIEYSNLSGSNDTNITVSSGTDWVNNNIATRPPVIGRCDGVYFNKKRYDSCPDTDEYFMGCLFPYGYRLSYKNSTYPIYLIRHGNCNRFSWNLDNGVFKFNNVLLTLGSLPS